MHDSPVIEHDTFRSPVDEHRATASTGGASEIVEFDDFPSGMAAKRQSGLAERLVARQQETEIVEHRMKFTALSEIESSEVLESAATPVADVGEGDDIAPGRGSVAAFFFVVDQCIVSTTSFLTTVAVGRTGSREELGRYYLAFSILLFARNWQAQLVTDPYKVYWSRQGRSSRGAYLGSTLVQNSVLTFVMMLALLAYIILLQWGTGPRELLPITWVLLAGLPFLLFREFIRNVVLSHLRAFAAIAIDSTVAILQIGLLLILRTCII